MYVRDVEYATVRFAAMGPSVQLGRSSKGWVRVGPGVSAGGSAPVVQALAGHLHLTTTQRYAHADRSDLAAAMAAFGARAAQSGS